MLPTSALDYDLPPGLIAVRPVSPRDSARMLVIDRAAPDRVQDREVRDLPDLLGERDLLVFNTTRVLPARFHGERIGTGGKMEGLFLRDTGRGTPGEEWVALIRGRHTRTGAAFAIFDRAGGPSGIGLHVTGRPDGEPGAWTVRVEGAAGRTSAEVLGFVGSTPLPPYILRARRSAQLPQDEPEDPERYQTVYADAPGSVAAPTAGLHFTDDLLSRLRRAGVARADVLLHVGAGTFRPVETEFIEEHVMHAECCSMNGDAIGAVRRAREAGGRVIAVGTTAARTLESHAPVIDGSGPPPPDLWTRLLITPGYRFRWVDGILTNFHLPRSTLLAMVAALFEEGVGPLKRAYAHAIAKGYRFYSYGDACLIVEGGTRGPATG